MCFIPFNFISNILFFNCFLLIFKWLDNSNSLPLIIILGLYQFFSTNSSPNILISFEYSILSILYCIIISSISSFISLFSVTNLSLLLFTSISFFLLLSSFIHSFLSFWILLFSLFLFLQINSSIGPLRKVARL